MPPETVWQISAKFLEYRASTFPTGTKIGVQPQNHPSIDTPLEPTKKLLNVFCNERIYLDNFENG